MDKEDLQQYAQGRVWSGKRALQNGLIDGLGGLDQAVSIAKQEAGIGAHCHLLSFTALAEIADALTERCVICMGRPGSLILGSRLS